MSSRFDTVLVGDFARSFSEFKETIVRRIHGSRSRFENVEAVVERDSRMAGINASRGGLEQTSETLQYEQSYLVEVAADQEVLHDDTFLIDRDVWKVLGESIGGDGGSKTMQVVLPTRIRGRKSALNQ